MNFFIYFFLCIKIFVKWRNKLSNWDKKSIMSVLMKALESSFALFYKHNWLLHVWLSTCNYLCAWDVGYAKNMDTEWLLRGVRNQILKVYISLSLAGFKKSVCFNLVRLLVLIIACILVISHVWRLCKKTGKR